MIIFKKDKNGYKEKTCFFKKIAKMKANSKALPPLAPPPQSRPELKKITSLVNKALTSTSLKEKNDILQEMRVMWIPQNEELENILTVNTEKSAELEKMQKQMVTLQNTCDTLKTNTSFYYKAEMIRSRRSEATIERSIKSTEAELTKIASVNFPQKLSQVNELKEQPDQFLFTLIDLNLARLEEMAYAYKKRLLIVEQSQESTDLILKEFGSVYGLLDREKQLADENQKLRDEEKSYIKDAFTRRRKFAEMPPVVARNLSSVFKRSIEFEKDMLENFSGCNFEVPDVQGSDLDFDAICGDTGFTTEPNHFDEQEFSSTSDELAEQLNNAKDSRDRLRILRELIHVMETNNAKLMQDITACRQKRRPHQETPQTRLDKLLEENDHLFERVAAAQDSLEKNTEESCALAKDVLTMMKHRSGFQQAFVDTITQLRDLSKGHTVVKSMLSLDKDIVSTITMVTSALGKYLLESDCNAMRTQIESEVNSSAKALEDSQPPPPVVTAPPKEEVHEEEVSMMSLATRQKKPRKPRQHKDNVSTGRPTDKNSVTPEVASTLSLEIPQPISSIVEKPLNPSELLMGASRAELLNAVSLALDLGGFTVGINLGLHDLFHDSFKNMLSQFKGDTSAHMQTFGQHMAENFGTIRLCSNRILVKQKENVAIQTEAAPRSDECIQVGEEPHTGRKSK